MDRAAAERMWASFVAASGVRAQGYDVVAFGDAAAMADELAELVLRGRKRATTGLLLDYERDGEPVPQPGAYSVVLDGRGAPVCVIRTTEVEVKPIRSVDAAFAREEGEGDRTLAWWLDAHRRFFARRCAAAGMAYTDDLLAVFERFELVWPPSHGRWRPDQTKEPTPPEP